MARAAAEAASCGHVQTRNRHRMSDETPLLAVDDLRGTGVGPISLTLAAGERVAIMGASGAGKSLFLRQLADLDPGEGHVALRGERREAMAGSTWRQRVMLVPAQSGWWAPTVDMHVDPSARAHAATLAHRLRLPDDILTREVRVLSTGERQRLALIRALARSPAVLWLDEPTSGLDPDAMAAVEALLIERSHEGVGIVMVTHDATQARRVANRSFLMEKGRLVPAWA